MEYSKSELRNVQEIEIEILRDIKRVCEENDIEYFLIGGTALGAQRHEGFIPWDDDIDIGMTRENYNKFLNIAQSYIHKDFFLQTPYEDKNSPFAYAKVRKNNTVFVEWCNRNVRMHSGIYVDIFPYDNIPDDEFLRKKQFQKVQLLQKLFMWRQTPDINVKPLNIGEHIKNFIRRSIYLFIKLIPKKIILSKLNYQMCLYNDTNTKTKACLFFPKYMVECMENEVLYPLCYTMFENISVPVPNNIDKYLKTHYGNYEELPPKEERVGHKPYRIKY